MQLHGPAIYRIFVAYALSGFVALGYQVAWFRIFADRYGSTNLTFALVLCGFIGGLGLGALASKPITRQLASWLKSDDQLRIYGLVELLISLGALLTVAAAYIPADLWGTFPYTLSDGIWQLNLAYQVGEIAIGIACVAIPCFFMGITFPLLCDAFVHTQAGPRFPAALYAWNTLGACAGVLGCQFVLLVWIGHGATYWLMIGLNLVIAGYFLVAGGAPRKASPGPLSIDTKPDPAGLSPAPGVLLACAVLSGLLAGALEGDMFRRLSFAISTNPGGLMPAISFWAILAIFLGSTLVHRMPRLGLAAIKVAFVIAGLYYFVGSRYIYSAITAIAAIDGPVADPTVAALTGLVSMFPASTWQLFAITGLLVFPPFLLISLLLPWVCVHLQAEGRHLGLAYGLNTAAFCIGLVCFTLIAPLVNIFYSLKLMMVVLACGIGFLLLLGKSRLGIWQPVAALIGLVAGIILTPSSFDRDYMAPGSDPARLPITALMSNGAHTTFVVHKPGDARLYFGNLSMSATTHTAQTYMRLMAHWPLMAQDHPRKALLICFGVGNTASAIATHESIRRIDIVDLNDRVFATAPEFRATNAGVYADPRARLIHDDGRSFLHRTDQQYDLITSEPPPPMAAGVYRLYSTEYYEDALAHLTPQGMMTQWLPIYQMPAEAVRLAIASFVKVFPESHLYVGSGSELILVGGRQALDPDRVLQRFHALATGVSGSVMTDLHDIGVNAPADLFARILRTDAELRQAHQGAETLSDQHNAFDHLYLTPDRLASVPYDPRVVLASVKSASPQAAALMAPIVQDPGRLRYHVENFPLYAMVPSGEVRNSSADWRQIAGLQLQSERLTEGGDPGRAIQALDRALAIVPDQPALLMRRARLMINSGQLVAARQTLERSLGIEPDDPVAIASIAEVLQAEGRGMQALPYYERATGLRPYWSMPLNNMAWILAAHPDPAVRQPPRAVATARRALDLAPDDPTVLDTLAVALAADGEFAEAATTARHALALAGSGPLADGIRSRLLQIGNRQTVQDQTLAAAQPQPGSQ